MCDIPARLVSVTGKTNIKDDELDAMLKEASGPINFTMFLNMFGAKLTGESQGQVSTMGPGSSLARAALGPVCQGTGCFVSSEHLEIQTFT